MKQSCCFAEACGRDFNKKHMGVNKLLLQLCVHEYKLTTLCEKGTQFVSRCWGLLLEISGAIGRSFDKSRKLMTLQQNPNIPCIFKFSFKYLCGVSQQIKVFNVQ